MLYLLNILYTFNIFIYFMYIHKSLLLPSLRMQSFVECLHCQGLCFCQFTKFLHSFFKHDASGV